MYKILLVDDEILVRDAIRENIDWKSLDCELVGDCENGRQAVEFVQSHKVDVVLTDICMPYMDGMELSEFLHDNYPDILIVIFSGFGEFEYAKKAIRYNVSEYMLKPVTAMELTKCPEYERETGFQKKKNRKKWNPCRRFKGLSQECGCHPVESTGDSCKLYQRCTGKSSGTEKAGDQL